jgi:signal transduction histidine kinase
MHNQEHLAELGTLTGGLAHEIKNPLSAIKLNLQLLAEDFELAEDDVGRRHFKRLRRLQDEVQRLHDILGDFLRFVANQELQTEEVDLRQALEELIDFFRPQAEAARVVLRGLMPPQPVFVDVDVPLFKQAVLNLLINAVQAVSDGESRQGQPDPNWSRGGELILRLTTSLSKAVLEVIDTGPGIPQDVLPRIFDAYYSTRPGGTGLGLPTTRRIIRQHQGDLVAESEVGKGTRFRITLPMTRRRAAGR